jgi:cell fate regulator YaaT (PSP1 superfamily)
MPDIVGIRFKTCGKIYDFESSGMELKPGDFVVVESDFGLSIGRVVTKMHHAESRGRELKKIIRLMDENDRRAKANNAGLEKDARTYCLERIMARGLPMKLVGAESTLDRRRIIFYFTADGRIDFRELVKDLAARFKTRIEMRQIGVRDEAKLLGGLGICGRTLCCNTFLTSFEPVSIKMAKKQELALNVGKLSGLCSRLMCCLRYEYEGNLEEITTDDVPPAEVEVSDKDISDKIMAVVLSKLDGEETGESRPPGGPQSEDMTQQNRLPEARAAVRPQEGPTLSGQAGEKPVIKPLGQQSRKKRRRRFRK